MRKTAHKSKNLQAINAGEDVKEREPSYTVFGNVTWYKNYREYYGDALKNSKKSYHMMLESHS